MGKAQIILFGNNIFNNEFKFFLNLFQLGQILQRDCSSIPLEICDLESHGVVLRVCPLESSPNLASAESRLPTNSELDAFTSNLRQHLVSSYHENKYLIKSFFNHNLNLYSSNEFF